MTSYVHSAASPPPSFCFCCCALQRFNYLRFATECQAWCLALPQGRLFLSCLRRKGTLKDREERGNWIFDTCHFHSAAPCSLATCKDFSCHSSACYEWAQGLKNPITTTVSDPCHHPYICYSHVPQIRKDVPISSFSSLQTGLPPPFQSVCLRYQLQLLSWAASLLTILCAERQRLVGG